MEKKELAKLHDYLRVSQGLRDRHGWDGAYGEPVSRDCLCDMQEFFAYLSSQMNLKKVMYPDVGAHPFGGLTLEWEKITEENGKHHFDFFALTFFGNKTITLDSDLEYLGIKSCEEFELTNPLDNTIIQHIKYF